MALEALRDIGDKFKADYLINVLTGKTTALIKSYGHNKSKWFGAGAEHDVRFWGAVLRQALILGLVDKNIENYGLISVNRKGENFIAMPFPVTGDWYAEVRHGVEGGGSYTSSYFLSFSKNGFTSIENFMEDMEDLSIDYGGYCTYLGMTEQGMIYLFNLYNSNGDVRDGTFLLDFYDSENDLLRVIPVSGVNLFDAAEGGSTTFARTYG